MATIKFGKKAKKVGDKAQVPGPSAPLWLQTYGDFVTLVLTFFVMLLATMSSSVNDSSIQTAYCYSIPRIIRSYAGRCYTVSKQTYLWRS